MFCRNLTALRIKGMLRNPLVAQQRDAQKEEGGL